MKNSTFVVVLLLFAASCNDGTTNDDRIYLKIPGNVKVSTINMVDEKGVKQGRWEDLDTINHRTIRQMFYTDGILDSTFLEYKKASSDTLVFGYYKSGKKHGTWKYWDSTSNVVVRTEQYENGTLK